MTITSKLEWFWRAREARQALRSSRRFQLTTTTLTLGEYPPSKLSGESGVRAGTQLLLYYSTAGAAVQYASEVHNFL